MARAPPFQTSCTLATSFFPLQLKSVQFNHIVSSNLVVKRLAFPLRVRFGFRLHHEQKPCKSPRSIYLWPQPTARPQRRPRQRRHGGRRPPCGRGLPADRRRRRRRRQREAGAPRTSVVARRRSMGHRIKRLVASTTPRPGAAPPALCS